MLQNQNHVAKTPKMKQGRENVAKCSKKETWFYLYNLLIFNM